MEIPRPDSNNTIPPQVFTVANVYVNPATPEQATVIFFQSARLYRLLCSNPHFALALQLLQAAKQHRQSVTVYLTEAFGDTIEQVALSESGH